MTQTQLRRDSFARQTLIRKLLPLNEQASCKWCGHECSRFAYGWEDDSFRPRTQFVGPFCTVSCYESYSN